MTHRLLATTFVTVAVLAGCHRDHDAAGPMERAGRGVDNAADKTGTALKGAAHKTGEALDSAGQATGKAFKKVGNKLEGESSDKTENK